MISLFALIFVFRQHCLARLKRVENDYNTLPDRHKQLLPTFKKKLKDIATCMAHNYEIIKLVLSHTSQLFDNRESIDGCVSVTFTYTVKIKNQHYMLCA